MFPFWGPVISPLLRAAGARSVVEVGALRGENTRQILDSLGDDGVLHVIDPVPAFDPAAHSAELGDRYVFHQALSLDVLGTLAPMDAALIDGDHNWYTVLNELRLLREVSRRAGRPLPLLVLHDVCWPYGRRDLYYAPETIPAEHRQPMARAGMRPGQKRLAEVGGLSSSHWHAVEEGGPRNGVMTALDDFLAEHDRPVRRVVLPLYFGLAIVAEEERIEATPGLDEAWRSLETAATKDRLLELGELLRLRAITQHHTVAAGERVARRRLADRYLDAVVRGLVDDLYPENELRIEHLLDCIDKGTRPNEALLRDPARGAATALESLRGRRQAGLPGVVGHRGYTPCLEPAGRAPLDALGSVLDDLDDSGVVGDVVSIGAGTGGLATYLRAHLEVGGPDDRHLWLVDRFRAGDAVDLNGIRDVLHRFDLLDDRVRILQGDPAAVVADAALDEIALLHLGPLGEQPVDAALDALLPRLTAGSVIVVDGRNDDSVVAAVDARLDSAGVPVGRTPVAGGGWSWQVASGATGAPSGSTGSSVVEPGAPRVPLAPPVDDPVDLSVVVVFYDMAREARRTLHSLSRVYQRDLDDVSYEVVVVENGSAPDQRLGEELVRSFGPEFRYLDRGADADPSPATALNAGIAASRGDVVALMIDGAHVLTPRVLRYGLLGLAAYEPAVVATQAWYVGPGQQGELMEAGYDQAVEDALFEGIAWPADGYRLFDIGHIAGDRDWLDGLWESNCLFVRRVQLEQVGGFDEGFSMAGGGYANLDLYERLGASPDIEIVTILGEGSFHQVHGGTTTNQADPAERRSRVHGYAEHYAELRGRPFVGPEKPVRYVGAFTTTGSQRTRARRMTGSAFDVDPRIEGVDGPGAGPVPMPEEVRDAFVAAYWRTRAWRKGTWLGHQVWNAPTDLFAYQEMLHEVRPDWIVETGGRAGGRALFLATVCDLVDHGRVLCVGAAPDGRPDHPRITWVDGSVTRPEVAEEVHRIVGPDPRALVILGTRGKRNRMEAEFEALAPLVPVGSYVVLEHTVLNGRPVDASFGPGPFEAMRRILLNHGEFAIDTERERQSLTFNPHGFLRRTT